jgi:hypothetical protein
MNEARRGDPQRIIEQKILNEIIAGTTYPSASDNHQYSGDLHAPLMYRWNGTLVASFNPTLAVNRQSSKGSYGTTRILG